MGNADCFKDWDADTDFFSDSALMSTSSPNTKLTINSKVESDS
jgi:hypothetical protein